MFTSIEGIGATAMELMPEEQLLAAAIRLAIRDALQEKNERLRAEAWRWLWMVAPAVAERITSTI